MQFLSSVSQHITSRYRTHSATHYYTVSMSPFMLLKFLPRTKAPRTYVDGLVRRRTYGVGTFDADSMGQVAFADVAADVNFRFVQR